MSKPDAVKAKPPSALLVAVALVLGGLGATAMAAGPGDLGTLDAQDPPSVDIGNSFSAASSGSAFKDVYTFDLQSLADVSGQAHSTLRSSGGILSTGLTRLQGRLVGPGLTDGLLDTDLGDGFAFEGLLQGHYTFTLTGWVAGMQGGSYGGDIGAVSAVVSNVPEPGSMSLALAGLGVGGLLLRRRRQPR